MPVDLQNQLPQTPSLFQKFLGHKKTIKATFLAGVLALVSFGFQAPSAPSNPNIHLIGQTGIPLSCADVTTRCVPSEYATITTACTASNAGDVIWVDTGSSATIPSCSKNGTSGNTITILANGSVTVCGLSFSSNSYIRVVGLTLDPALSGCSTTGRVVTASGVNTGLEFWDVAIASNAGSVSSGAKGYDFFNGASTSCTKCIWMGGSIHNIGGGAVADSAMNLYGNDNFVGYVDFATICYIGVGQGGSRGRFVNLNFSGFIQCGGSHPDFFFPDGGSSTLGFSNTLIESVFGIGTVTSVDNKFAHQSNQSNVAWNDNVWRFMVAYNLGSGFYSVYGNGTGCPLCGAQNRLHFYNNTILNCVRASPTTNTCGNFNLDAGGSAYIYNELLYEAWGDSVTTNVIPWNETAGTFTRDYNFAFDPEGAVTFQAGWTNQVHEQSNVDPKLNNFAGLDFTLQAASGARGVGGPLTAAVGSGSSSTVLTVTTDTGSFFIGDNASNLPQYGGLLVPGDFITVGSTTVQVLSVSGDVLTLATPISWANGAAIYFGTSATVDVGAYPYKAGGYTLTATKAQGGSTITVTPNDATLARFAVIYENGMPKCIAAAANSWACTVGSGVVTAYIYPRYPSQTQRTAIP